jgi:hypothetical protein
MRTLPDNILAEPLINKVYNWYLMSFVDMQEHPSTTAGVR